MVVGYDSDWGLIEGTGVYTVASSTKSGCTWTVSARVEEEDERRVPVHVTVRIGGVQYTLLSDRLEVDGNAVTIPYDNSGVNVAGNGGDGVILNYASCDLRVTFGGQGIDTISQVTVGNIDDYQGSLDGMCGNCNGNAGDDLNLADGNPIGDDGDRFVRWSDSWQVGGKK
eukprot:GHVT01067162.1.p1 GENE.GHVT01067162.1~~GHVT01067162.1.p1  ORF type:complete len:170 (-),score=0.52 GHVT01067162.1:116-625(-)